MRILKSELRLRVKNRKARPFGRAASSDDAGPKSGDSAISSPSTPKSSLSSQSNLVSTSSSNTPSPATPTQQQAAPLGSAASTPITAGTPGSSGHKNSFKGTKLARRARSFKDDIISLMRTPTNTLGRSHSPHSPRTKNAKPRPTAEEVAKSSQSLDTHVKDISNGLKHFRDVVLKKKLEVLPGNGTVILETIASMFAVIQSYALNESSTVLSATQQVYQALGNLIKLCDEVMLSDESADCPSLSNENVSEVVDQLEGAVKNLVSLAQQRLKEREENTFMYGPNAPDVAAIASSNHLMRPPVEVAGQRTSLPDITLTPKERDILEKTNSNPIRASHSTESILRDTSPPPKPPLPNRVSNPPPLPPKRRSQKQNHHSNNISINSDLDCGSDFSLMNYGIDHLSVRSRSPDENSSQCSLDSALNHSREEEELKMLGLETKLDEHLLEDDVEKMLTYSFVSMKSFRTSTQSVSKRSSDYSFQSSAKSSSSEIGMSTVEATTISEFVQLQQQQQQMTTTNFSSCISSSSTTTAMATSTAMEQYHSSSKVYSSNCIGVNLFASDDNCSNTSSTSPDHVEREKLVMNQIQSMSSLTKTNSLDISSTEDMLPYADIVPPALPPKVARNRDRQSAAMQFDHFDEVDNMNHSFVAHDLPELRTHNHHQQIYQWHTKHQSLIEPRRAGGLAGSCNAIGMDGSGEEPPPLPIKKKHILAYMEICSASTRSIEQHRHTMHAYNLNRNITHSQTMNIVPLTKEMSSPEREIPPALPPKNYKQRKQNAVAPPTIITTPPPSPKPSHLYADGESVGGYSSGRHGRVFSNSQANELMSTVCEEVTDLNEEEQAHLQHSHKLMNERESDGNADGHSPLHSPRRQQESNTPICTPDIVNEEDEGIDVVLENNSYNNRKDNLPNMLEELDITPYLILKKDNEDGPEVKGGYIDALIVHATRVQKISNNAFCEAFITTFRTFIQPIDVIEKLIHRYSIYFCQLHDQKQKAAKETFSLLVRVVNDLTQSDLTSQLHVLLMDFVFQLVCSGELYMAKLLRNKFIEKVTLYKDQRMPNYQTDIMYSTVTNQPSLLDLKSVEIAEQMTLLDAELFQKIEIPEVLLFAKEQCEEKSPNLNKFTEHFNKMSYWARSKILMLPDAKEREKHVIKFIKIMKHLRKMNNYNSYLALLSALDSAPVRRLEWHKTITEGLKEYCTLIDSSSSFRVYRQALAETSPPCIPYIGLVLQDLTFVHVGNPDYLKEGVINFSKRWQQYNIIVNMKRFNKCAYPFKRNERIINFFENFEKFLGEEEMWQISESIKPRGKRPTHH